MTGAGPPRGEGWPGRLHAILGAPGLAIGLFSLASFGFGLVILAREYNALRDAARAAVRPVVIGWVRDLPVHYVGRTLRDYAAQWQAAPAADRGTRRDELRDALAAVGEAIDRPAVRLRPLVEVAAIDLVAGREAVASWRTRRDRPPGGSEVRDRFELVAASGRLPAVEARLRYRLDPAVERVAAGIEQSYRRLLLAVAGLSGYSLLCLAYMVRQARVLSERAATESAQRATLDLADRTCHELGNVAFILANERRNLADHLDLIARFVAEETAAVAAAARRAGLDEAAAERLARALRREYAARGLDPSVELRDSVRVAADVARQVSVSSDYIALTVRELDGYLKQSGLPVEPRPLDPSQVLDDALALLRPALEGAAARVDRRTDAPAPKALADRRLLIHALINLLKNGLEAAAAAGRPPRIAVEIRGDEAGVSLSVSDNGEGIPADLLPRIFDVGVSTKGTGRGRGLAIVRDSVASQGGTLSVESPPGRGATFTIRLPRAPGSV